MIRRELYLKKLEMYAGKDAVKILIGMRRTGKTTILQQFMEELKGEGIPEENIVYINFEVLAFTYFERKENLRDLLEEFRGTARGRMYFFLDELQRVDGWAGVLAQMMDRQDCEFFVSSSSETLLYETYAAELSYRYVRIDVYPFVFSEYLKAADMEGKSRERLFEEFLVRGGLPGAYALDSIRLDNYYRDTCSAIVLKDVVQCHKLRDLSHVDKILEFLFTHLGESFSPKGIRDSIRQQGGIISVDTVYSILEALCHARLVYRVPRFDIRAERQLESLDKYYVADLAMRNAVCGEAEIPRKAALENILYLELLSRNFRVNAGKSGSGQVDFIAFKGNDRTYLNCWDLLKTPEDVKREFSTLVRIHDNYFKMVLTMDEETKVNRGGIINYPLIRFLEQE